MFLVVLPWSQSRYQYLDEGCKCRYQDHIEELPRSLLNFVYQFTEFCQILSQIRVPHRNTNNLALLSFKHVKLYANGKKLLCKHSNRLLPSPSWIFATHLDLGNEFPFQYRDYWGMAVAITGGCRAYLLPILAAHSSFNVECNHVNKSISSLKDKCLINQWGLQQSDSQWQLSYVKKNKWVSLNQTDKFFSQMLHHWGSETAVVLVTTYQPLSFG